MAPDTKRLQLPIGEKEHIAFSEFYGEYSALCFSIAVGITHDIERAKDIVQESFVSIYRQVTERGLQFDSKSHARNYLLKTVRHGALDSTTSQTRNVEIGDGGNMLMNTINQEETFLTEKKLAALRSALKELPSNYRDILKLRFFHKMTLAQIAEKTGKSIPTIQYWEKKALEKLQRSKILKRFFHKNGF